MFPTFKKNYPSQHSKLKERLNTLSEEKSFHVERQTFYPNNFKKIKATEFLFKENHSNCNLNMTQNSTSFKWSSRLTQSVHDNNNIIGKLMKRKKGDFQNTINHCLLQVNRSFNRYICNKSSEEEKVFQQRKKIISCKNILKELKQMHSLSKLNFPLVNVNQKNLLEMATDTNYEISSVENKCFDSMFPFDRYGASITSYQNELILYGGFTSAKRSNLVSCFHKYNFQTKIWTKAEEPFNKPMTVIPCFHSVDIYKNFMIIVGGISVGPDGGGRRKFNSDICIYNFEKKEWIKLRSSLTIRSHASTLFGNTLLIHGGIDEKQSNSNQMHFINFNPNSIQNSLILTTQNKQHSLIHKHALSHHKIVNTNEVDQNLKMLLKYDGVFCFGGVNNEGEMHNDISFLNCIGKQNGLDVRFQSWVTVQLIGTGPRPQARKNHTFNVINKKALILLIGGQNSYGQILSDIWVFNLIKLQWKQVSTMLKPLSQMITDNSFSKEQNLEQGISGHCSTFLGSRLFVFGGRKSISNKKENCLWEIETDIINNFKKNLKVDKSSNPSINTIKESNMDESMWNIEF